MNRLMALAPAASFLLLIVVFAGYLLTHHSPQVIPRATVGRAAPAEILPTLEGGAPQPIRTEGSGPMLVNFYASWCPPCAEEAPVLVALKAQGVTIVGVAWKDDPAKTKNFLARYGDPYAARFVDRDGRAGIDFGITAAPETYVIGADGKIIDKIAAPLSQTDAETLAAELKR